MTSDTPSTTPITALLPHRGIMLRLDTLLAASEERAEGRFVIRPDDPFLCDGILSQEALIETAAQTVAASQGWRALCEGQPPPQGMLIGLEDFAFHRPVVAGDQLHVTATRSLQKAALHIAHCVITEERSGALVAGGTLKFYVGSF